MKKVFITLSFFLIVAHSYAQLAMGKWRTHFAYNAVSQIAQTENKVFALSDGSLYAIEKFFDEQTPPVYEFYSKTNGLTDNNISRIDYDNFNKRLLIIYKNGNIDFLGSGGIINLPDLYNKPMSINKLVNHVLFTPERAYLSTNFGVLVLNTKKNEVADTYFIGPNGSEINILGTVIFNSRIYAITANSILSANVNERNLVNFEFWNSLQSLPGTGAIAKIGLFRNRITLLRNKVLYSLTEQNAWEQLPLGFEVNDVIFDGPKLVVNENSQTSYLIDESLVKTTISNLGDIADAEFDTKRNAYWIAGGSKGVLLLNEANPSLSTQFKPSGPSLNIPYFMKFAGKKLFVVPGGLWAGFENRPGNIMIYEQNKWKNIDHKRIEAITGFACRDFVSIAVDPTNNKRFFVSSISSGIYEFNDTTLVQWYNVDNSGLEAMSNNKIYHITYALQFDKAGNLWVVNALNARPIKVLTPDKKWIALSHGVLKSDMMNLNTILISNQNPNQKWLNIQRWGKGLFVFDDKGTIENVEDDSKVFWNTLTYLESDNTGTVSVSVSPGLFYCLAQDLNGVIWLGTDNGPFLFYNTANIFRNDYTVTRVKIPRNDGTNLADYLLKDERVKAIAIDGANRKWLGTENSGVYLMSENGQETIKHFTVANSPLLSNDILSIAINPETGEVFFGTGNGLISYQSDASQGNDIFNNVHAYPNPVRENYNGIITITGLVKNTQVKITDINGNVVYQTVSNGSLATWDGKQVNGQKVRTGVYLVVGVNEDGTQSVVTKLMVIN